MADTDILADPAWFPDRIDPENQLIRLVHTRHDILAENSFLDGRMPLSDGSSMCILSFAEFIEGLAPAPAMRWIFHASFCGSTLLARIATVDGQALCLREPQILNDLAERAAGMAGRRDPEFSRLIDAVLSKLSQRWQPDEPIAIKPSNWVNPILPDLWHPARGDRAVLVTIGQEDFLVAVLRGGRDRITYILRLFERFAAQFPMFAPIVDDAMPATRDPMVRASCLVTALHWSQQIVIAARCTAASLHQSGITLDFPHFLDDPLACTTMLVDRLALPIPADALADSLSRNLPRHSKMQQATPQDENAVNAEIRVLHKDSIAAASTFADALATRSAELIEKIAADMSATDRDGSGRFDQIIRDIS